MSKVNHELMEVYLQDDSINKLFVSSNSVFGEFFIEGLKISLYSSDQPITNADLDNVKVAKDILLAVKSGKRQYSTKKVAQAREKYWTFSQAHHHELTHFYQVLALPAFQAVWASRYYLLQLEAQVMLDFIKNDGIFYGEKHKGILQVLEDDYYSSKAKNDFIANFNSIMSKYSYYVIPYKENKIEGITLFHIIEGMAHIISLQLSDEEDDLLGVEYSKIYTNAYDFYEKNIDGIELNLYWKRFLFIYICFFSCQHLSRQGNSDNTPAVNIFIFLCMKAKHYITSWLELKKMYSGYTLDELKKINQWNILSKDELELLNYDQLSSAYAFLWLIDFINDEVFPSKKLKVSGLSDFFTHSKRKNIDWGDKYTLAKIIMFRDNFVWVRDVYDETLSGYRGNQEYTYSQEANFYSYILDCRHILNPLYDVWCCREHGMDGQRKKILKCNNNNSLAIFIEAITGRPAYEIFKF